MSISGKSISKKLRFDNPEDSSDDDYKQNQLHEIQAKEKLHALSQVPRDMPKSKPNLSDINYEEFEEETEYNEIEVGNVGIEHKESEKINDGKAKSRQNKFRREKMKIKASLKEIKDEVKKLIGQNSKLSIDEQLDLGEFELDSDEEREIIKNSEDDKRILHAQLSSINDARYEWAKKMKHFVYDKYRIPGKRIKGFKYENSVANYPMLKSTPESKNQLNKMIRLKRFLRKIEIIENEMEIRALFMVKLQRNDPSSKSTVILNKTYPYSKGTIQGLKELDYINKDLTTDPSKATTAVVLKPHISFMLKDSEVELPEDGDENENLEDEDRNEPDINGEIGILLSPKETNLEQNVNNSFITTSASEAGTEEASFSDEEFLIVRNTPESELEREMLEEKNKAKDLYEQLSEDKKIRFNFLKNLFAGDWAYNFVEIEEYAFGELEIKSIQELQIHMIITESLIVRLKDHFNSEFEKVFHFKLAEIEIIKNRNMRCREIAGYLGFKIELPDPVLCVEENMESVFIVEDSEVPISKYYTNDEKKVIKRLKDDEDEKRAQFSESFYERALIVMMDGVLEKNKEDVLNYKTPKPEFLDKKNEWEWSPEELRQAEDYFRKDKELERIQAGYRKDLEDEIKNILIANSETKSQIDTKIKKLFELKIEIEMNVKMLETKICRGNYQIMIRESMIIEEKELRIRVRQLQEELKEAQSISHLYASKLDQISSRQEVLMQNDKNLEKYFKRDLGQVSHHFETFNRLFKKRPKFDVTESEKPIVNSLLEEALYSQNLKNFGREKGPLGQKIAHALFELDNALQTPMGASKSTWDHFCRLRREKILHEVQLKIASEELENTKKIYEVSKQQEDRVIKDLTGVLHNLNKQREYRMNEIYNLEFQIAIPQGKIEMEWESKSDFENSVMIFRDIVEKSNVRIKKLGDEKIAGLIESKNFRRNVKQMEWEYKRANLELEFVLENYRDISSTKVSREIIEFLRNSLDFQVLQTQRIQRIADFKYLADTNQKKYMEKQEELKRALIKNIKIKKMKNNQLGQVIMEENTQLNEGRHLCKSEEMDLFGEMAKRKVDHLLRIGKLSRVIACNCEKILVLETTLDKLYRANYGLL